MTEYLDQIPAKIYLQVEATGNLHHLNKYFKGFSKLEYAEKEKIWFNLMTELESIKPKNESSKTFNLYKDIEKIQARYTSIFLAIRVLRGVVDREMLDLLIENGYKISYVYEPDREGLSSMHLGDLREDLKRIEAETEAFDLKLNLLGSKLPKLTKSTISFDETVMVCASINGLGFIDTNKITYPQYYANMSIAEKKIAAMKKDGRK